MNKILNAGMFPVLIIILFYPFKLPGQTIQQNNIHWEFTAGYQLYQSYSQQKTDLPMNIGYPVLLSETGFIAFAFNHQSLNKQHTAIVECNYPSKINSDNGSGKNMLVDRSESTYFRANITYRLRFNPLRINNWLEIVHGLNSGLRFERRLLSYLSGDIEKVWDGSASLGPALHSVFSLNKDISVDAHFFADFYLPYFSYGRIQCYQNTGIMYFQETLHGFSYNTTSGIRLIYRNISLAIDCERMVGYATPRYDFDTEGIVNHKLNRVINIKASYIL